MSTFMLVLTFWSSEVVTSEIVDYNLTAEDCINGMVELETFAVESGAVISCEFDYYVEE